MQKLLYYCLFFSSIMTRAHTSLQSLPLSQPSLPWYGVVDKKDLAVAATVTAAFCGGSFFIKDKKTRAAVQAVALLAPLVRLLSTTRVVKKTLNNVPLIKEVFGCTAESCEGICNECVMRHTLVDAGVGAALCSLGAPIAQFLSKRAELKEKEKTEKIKKESEVIKKECKICYIDKEERYCASPLCCKENNVICRTCIDSWYEEKGSSYEPSVSCPFCRQDMICPLPDKEASQVDTTESAFELTKEDESQVTSSLPNDPFSTIFNKAFLASGSMTSLCTSLLSYSDHRATVKDMALAVACSGGLVALASQLKEPTVQRQLLAAAFIMPFIGLINKSEGIRKFGNSIPFLKHIFGCEKEGCVSICAHCKMRNTQRGTAVLVASLLTAGGL